MGKYSIKELEQLSSIKAHTLRVWEQRYAIIHPKRTVTNIRYYDDADLRLILNISFLNKNGYKISNIARMSVEEIKEKVVGISDSNLEFPNQVNALVIAMVHLDEGRFEKIISTNTLQFGFEKTMLNIVFPFLARVGILWQTGSINPVHEHFITNLIRQKLVVAIDGQIPPQHPQTKKFILYLPEGELHELSLLFAEYIIKSRRNRVIFLGQSLPLADIELVGEVYNPDYLLTVITSYPTKEGVIGYIKELKNRCPATTILISGYQALQVKSELMELGDIIVFDQIDDILHFVDQNQDQPNNPD